MDNTCINCRYCINSKCACEVSPYYDLDKITSEQIECDCEEKEVK